MPVLRVLLDGMTGPASSDQRRYTRALTTALVATTPPGMTVEGVAPAGSEADGERIARELPGLRVRRSALGIRELTTAMSRGAFR